MSAIVSLPKEVLVGIFCYIPPEEIVTTCRAVCTDWKEATTELYLWQKVAELFRVTINPTASVPDIEVAVVRRYVVSTEKELKEKVKKYFNKESKEGTHAFCYLSGSNPKAIGFFIKTKNPKVHEKSSLIIQYGSIDQYQEFLSSFRGLTIIGEDAADYYAKEKHPKCSYRNASSKATGWTQYLDGKLINFFSENSFI
jgi:hypothetical protein